jgi:uncharacterized cupin superfamily protein
MSTELPVPVVTISTLETQPFKRGDSYESADAGIAEVLGLTQLGAVYSEVPPGKTGCPFHVHHLEDEMFFILAGSGEYRFGSQTYQVGAGDMLGAPRGGPEFAHKLTNTGGEILKYLAMSSRSATEVCEYPDSGKFMVRAEGFRFIGSQTDAHEYWEGEEGA